MIFRAILAQVSATTDITLRDISLMIGIFVMFAGVVGVWFEQRQRVKTLERDVCVSEKRHSACATLQAERYSELVKELQDINKVLIRADQKLSDIERYSKSGGPNNGKR